MKNKKIQPVWDALLKPPIVAEIGHSAHVTAYREEMARRRYEKHNARCLELGLTRPSRGQACPYRGGYPA